MADNAFQRHRPRRRARRPGQGFDDVLALFDRWRAEIDSEPAPPLIMLEVACILLAAAPTAGP